MLCCINYTFVRYNDVLCIIILSRTVTIFLYMTNIFCVLIYYIVILKCYFVCYNIVSCLVMLFVTRKCAYTLKTMCRLLGKTVVVFSYCIKTIVENYSN